MTKKTAIIVLFLFAGWGGAHNVLAGTAFVFQPVSASGTHAIIGSDIYLPSGPQRVRFEVRVAGWEDAELKTAQAALNAAGFDNGHGSLAPSIVSCPSNNNAGHNVCAQALEAGSRCANCVSGVCRCDWAFQNFMRADFLGFGFSNISAVDSSTLNARFGMALNSDEYVHDPGVSLYLGTFFLDVPAGAQGAYRLDIIETQTFLLNAEPANPPGNNDIPIDLYTGARIIIGDPVAPGSRYVAFEPEDPGQQTAIRVTLTSLYHPGPPVAAGEDRDFTAFEGQPRWLGPPGTFPDNAPGSSFVAAKVQCTPHFTDWGALGTVQVYGDAIVPSSIYSFFQVPAVCQVNPNAPECLGPLQRIHTGQWGDVAAPFARSDQPAQPDMADVAEIVDAFRGVVDAAPKSLTHLRGVVPNPATNINFLDVFFAVDAVRGLPYPAPLPSSCPP